MVFILFQQLLASSCYVLSIQAAKTNSGAGTGLEGSPLESGSLTDARFSLDLARRYEALFPSADYRLVEHVHMMDDDNPVQWAIVESHDAKTVIVVFMGTRSPTEILTGPLNKPEYAKDIDLDVNHYLWNALHSKKNGVAEQIIRKLAAFAGRNLVICGHSLGGGFATLFALELLQRGKAICAVISHGGPQVVVPNPENPLWKALNDVAIVYVNEFDIVPHQCRVPVV